MKKGFFMFLGILVALISPAFGQTENQTVPVQDQATEPAQPAPTGQSVLQPAPQPISSATTPQEATAATTEPGATLPPAPVVTVPTGTTPPPTPAVQQVPATPASNAASTQANPPAKRKWTWPWQKK